MRPKSTVLECCRASFDRGGLLRLQRCRKSPASWPEACCAWPRRSLLGRITSTSPSAAPSADHVVGASMDMDVQLSTRTSTTPTVRHSHRAMLPYFLH